MAHCDSHWIVKVNVRVIVKSKTVEFAVIKALLHCNFLSSLSCNAIARQVAGELYSVTWVVLQFFCCAKGCMK